MKNITIQSVYYPCGVGLCCSKEYSPSGFSDSHRCVGYTLIAAWLKSTSILVGYLFMVSLANASECVDSTRGLASMERANITLLNDSGKPVEVSVLVADDAFERAAGFQSICPSVIAKTLILFGYPSAIDGKFHMQNVHAPLDIVFFDSSGRFQQYLKMETYTEDSQPLYGPGRPFQYALEAPVGFFAEHGISGYPSQLLLNR